MGKTKAKNNSNSKKLKNEQYKFFTGIFFIFLAIYILLAFTSFFFTWKVDQSFEWGKVMSNANLTVENWGGKVGARLANLFIAKWFGIGSFSLPLIFLAIGAKLLRIKFLPVKKTIKYSILGTIIISLITGFIWDDMNGYLVNGLGGGHGVIMIHWLNAFIGKTGTAFTILLLLTAYTFSIINKPIFEIRSKMIHFFKNFPGLIIKVAKQGTDKIRQPKPQPETQPANKEKTHSESEKTEAESAHIYKKEKEAQVTDQPGTTETEEKQSQPEASIEGASSKKLRWKQHPKQNRKDQTCK